MDHERIIHLHYDADALKLKTDAEFQILYGALGKMVAFGLAKKLVSSIDTATIVIDADKYITAAYYSPVDTENDGMALSPIWTAIAELQVGDPLYVTASPPFPYSFTTENKK